MTSLKTSRKSKQSKKSPDLAALTAEWRKYNKEMRKQHLHSMQFETLEEYIAYTKNKVKRKKDDTFTEYKPSSAYTRDTKYIPSLGTGVGNALKNEPMKYTGTLVKGIATMHKSNAVPVISDEHAIDIAKMRRN